MTKLSNSNPENIYAKINLVKTSRFGKLDILGIGLTIALVAIAYGGYRFWESNKSQDEMIAKFKESVQSLNLNLATAKKENTDLAEALTNEQNKNQLYETQIKDISNVVGELSGTVGILKKLSQTDPELLKKYSKVYFLNENYIPIPLGVIDTQYLYDQKRPQQFQGNALPFLQRMLEAAKSENVSLKIVSAYRSFGEQTTVKSGYKVVYGAGTANQFSADQGYSEHQLGTAVDLTSSEIKEVFTSFDKTKTYKWLKENAHRFGFVLSYPPNNSYYQFEPWHWRFVGVALATKLHDENKYFYDMPQREIDGYLVNLFD